VEDGTRVQWAQLNSLIVLAKGGHSCCIRDSCVSCCQVDTLQGYVEKPSGQFLSLIVMSH
jgi:hypothetical protein